MRRVYLRRSQQRRYGQPRAIDPADFCQEIKNLVLLPRQGNNHHQETFDKILGYPGFDAGQLHHLMSAELGVLSQQLVPQRAQA